MCAGRPRHAFSLLELLVVLALLGMVAALVAPAALRVSLGDPGDAAVAGLCDLLAAARLDALRESAAVTIAIAPSDDGLSVAWIDQRRTLERWPMRLIDDADNPQERVEVRFGVTGLADHREIRLLAPDTGRMWRIGFDPVSGAPTWGRIEDGAQR